MAAADMADPARVAAAPEAGGVAAADGVASNAEAAAEVGDVASKIEVLCVDSRLSHAPFRFAMRPNQTMVKLLWAYCRARGALCRACRNKNRNVSI